MNVNQADTQKTLHVVSGIPPGTSGTGRLISHLVKGAEAESDWRIKFHCLSRPPAGFRQLLRERRFVALLTSVAKARVSSAIMSIKLQLLVRWGSGALLIFHPQTLGFKRTIWVLKKWNHNAFLFGLDNSFFCIRSYNYISGETDACLRCLGGRVENSVEMGCEPFPVNDQRAISYVVELRDLIVRNRVGIFAQNHSNAELYKRHAAPRPRVSTVGLWTRDWQDVFSEWGLRSDTSNGYDVVFHGNYIPAKGGHWLLEVARHIPELTVMFPNAKPRELDSVPSNVIFRPMTWETGLKEEVRRAGIVCVPSFWSATIEGALVKSILCAQRVARVDIDSAYGNELPDGLVIHLSPNLECAARHLRSAIEDKWSPDPDVVNDWLSNFERFNRDVLQNILMEVEKEWVQEN